MVLFIVLFFYPITANAVMHGRSVYVLTMHNNFL